MNDSLGKAPAGDQDGGPVRMSRQELRSSLWLASLYAIRMLGLFLVLPVFALHARQLPGGDDPAWVGFAFGAYGLTQALLQIPYGAASDRFGRKQVITVGLLVMAAGSVLAAMADTVAMLALGRALQGAGAVSAAISALVADSTRDENRSKAMALIGVMIAMSYAVSLVVGPVLYQRVGLPGMFLFTGALALLAIGVLWRLVPNPVQSPVRQAAPPLREVLGPDLWRLDAGIFLLHLTQMALFVVLPARLLAAGMAVGDHWQMYLPAGALGFMLMLGPMRAAERGNRMKPVFLAGVLLLALSQLGLAFVPDQVWPLAGLLLLFFTGFNLMEAMLPSLVSRLVPPNGRGLALGVYSTSQSLGVFAGGAFGGLVLKYAGATAVPLASALLLVLWWALARSARRWPSAASLRAEKAAAQEASGG